MKSCFNKQFIFQVLFLLFLNLFLNSPFTQAQIQPPAGTQPPDIPTSLFGCLPQDTIRRCMLKILDSALKVILVVALSFAALMIAYGGILYIVRGGEGGGEKQIKARSRIIYAAVGLVVAFISWVLTVLIERFIRQTTV